MGRLALSMLMPMADRCVPTMTALAMALLVGACAGPGALMTDGDPVRAAFVVLGEGGSSIVRVVTTDPACPAVDVDGAPLPMAIRAVPGTMPPRPTISAPT